MQMNNIFEKLKISTHYFDIIFIKPDLYRYLYDNLEDENDKFRWDLRNALKTNANGEYIY